MLHRQHAPSGKDTRSWTYPRLLRRRRIRRRAPGWGAGGFELDGGEPGQRIGRGEMPVENELIAACAGDDLHVVDVPAELGERVTAVDAHHGLQRLGALSGRP